MPCRIRQDCKSRRSKMEWYMMCSDSLENEDDPEEIEGW